MNFLSVINSLNICKMNTIERSKREDDFIQWEFCHYFMRILGGLVLKMTLR